MNTAKARICFIKKEETKTMPLDRFHYNYLYIGKKRCDLTLLNENVFPLVMDALNPLLAHTDIKKCRVTVNQYAGNKSVNFGKQKWDKISLQPVFQNYNNHAENGNFHFLFLKAEFPSIKSAYKQQESVDIYLSVENDLFIGRARSDGDCGLFLSLREDIYGNAGEELVAQTLNDIYKIFDEAKVLFHKRKWWGGSKTESALHEVAAYRAVHNLYSANYSQWAEINMRSS